MQTAHRGDENLVTNNPWLAFVRPNPQARLRLFCLPYSGAGASAFRAWPDSLPTTVEVCPVQLPGRESRLGEPSFTRLLPLVEATAQALLPHLDKPFALFGHSVGALASFELARHLRKQYDLEPAHLFISGHPAPQTPDPDPPIHALPEPEFVEGLRRYSGIPDVVLENAELRELYLPILRADFEIHETYTYTAEPLLDCPISVFAGVGDHKGSRANFEAWREQTMASCSLHMFEGGHFFLHSAQAHLLDLMFRELQQLVERLA